MTGLDPDLIGCAVELVPWDVGMLEHLQAGRPSDAIAEIPLGDLPSEGFPPAAWGRGIPTAADHMCTELVADALGMAVATRAVTSPA